MSFKKNKYQIIRGAISKEIAALAYTYLQISAEADNWMLQNGVTHAGNKLVVILMIAKFQTLMLNIVIDLWKHC